MAKLQTVETLIRRRILLGLIWVCTICQLPFKGVIFLKNRHFIIQERFNKLLYDINTIIKGGYGQPVKFQLFSHS